METRIINLGNRIVNCWAYPIESGYVVIDTGYPNGYQNFLKKLKKNGISIDKIKYCFLTHSHDDHVGFLAWLMRQNKDMQVIIHPNALEILRAGENEFGGCTTKLTYSYLKILKRFGKGRHLFPSITSELEDRITVVDESNIRELKSILGGKIIETTGHTKDSLSLLLSDGTLFCGDVAMNGFPSKNNVSVWAEEEEGYWLAWQKVISLRPKKIFPGHGKPFDCRKLEKNLHHAKKIKIYPNLP